METALAYYLYVNHGILPHVVADMPFREQVFAWEMAKKEMQSRK